MANRTNILTECPRCGSILELVNEAEGPESVYCKHCDFEKKLTRKQKEELCEDEF